MDNIKRWQANFGTYINDLNNELNLPRDDYRAIMEYIEEVPAQPEQRWIPMKERRPEKDGRYLCTFQGKAVHICMYLNGCFRIYGYNEDNLITAWMPLPEPYKEEEQND